ncbi:MAG: EamA family transporter [Bacteroidales bacterium]|jgi:transporter family protein|nr:EamA family transporter [Bacteroidales bacterium]
MWLLFAILSAVFASATAILIKVGVRDVDSNLATAIRTSVVLLLSWGIVAFSGAFSQIKTIPKFSWTFLILSGVATGLSWLCYFKAIQLGELSKVAPIDKLSVALTILFAIFFLGETVDVKTIVGASVILVGVGILVF